jgi:hypothetical protein
MNEREKQVPLFKGLRNIAVPQSGMQSNTSFHDLQASLNDRYIKLPFLLSPMDASCKPPKTCSGRLHRSINAMVYVTHKKAIESCLVLVKPLSVV